jgi:beta-lactamase superfamily II metal-dependent hydrolase
MIVRIRMYNVGFGDCFLLTFLAPDRPRKVLIDCGKHTLSQTGVPLNRIVQQILQDVKEDGEYKIDVVVATHRHLDHVQGFADKSWQQVSVGEVWMPWTEDPADSIARDICERQSRRAEQLKTGIAALGLSADEQQYLLSYSGNNLKNAAAMKTLHEGFIGNPERRFLPYKAEEKNQFKPETLGGVEVFAIAPSRDIEILKEMDPPEEESFLRAWTMNTVNAPTKPGPFDSRWSLSRADFEHRCGVPLEGDFPLSAEAHLGNVSDEPGLEAAARLESAVNATSLVLLFHLGDAWLLFTGDAQWGSWNTILRNSSHTKLLENISFYKVGHHGSHNATPISFVERFMSDRVRAMIPYGLVPKWPSIPRKGLIDRFVEKSISFARSDMKPSSSLFQIGEDQNQVLYIDTEIAT